MIEAEFQNAIVQAAHLHGWSVAHWRRATVRGGRTATPVAYDAAGFPDLILVHPDHGLRIREIKSDTGSLSRRQRTWITLLASAGVDVDVWRPRDWDTTIIPTLSAVP